MPLFVVTYAHPDVAGWRTHLAAHVVWLQDQLAQGVLRASGPFRGTPGHTAMLVLEAADRPALDALVASDPFAQEGLIADMTVTEWDPIFGAFHEDSSYAGQPLGAPPRRA